MLGDIVEKSIFPGDHICKITMLSKGNINVIIL